MDTILHVDDDSNDVYLLHHALRKAKIANPIQVASDGQQAIDYLLGTGPYADRAKFPFPCLVILDLKLPYITGLEVLRWIRQHPATFVTVIVMTASGSEADVVEAYHLGANAFLTKPSESRKMEAMAAAIRDFWLIHNTLPQPAFVESLRKQDTLPAVSSPAILPINGAPRPKTGHPGKQLE